MSDKINTKSTVSRRFTIARPRALLLTGVFVFVGGVAVSAFALLHTAPTKVEALTITPKDMAAAKASTPAEKPAAMTAQGASSNSSRGPVQLVRFTLYDVGIVPHQTQAQKGAVTLLFEDLTGGSTGLIIERQTGRTPERTGQAERAPRSRYGKQQLRLEPGRYEVYDASRPDNRALLVVEP